MTLRVRRSRVGADSLRMFPIGGTNSPLPVPQRVSVQRAAAIVLGKFGGASRRDIAKRLDNVTVWGLVDDTGSMFGVAGYDDFRGTRYAAAESIFTLLKKSSPKVRAGVVHWGSHVDPWMVAGPVRLRRKWREIRKQLEVPPHSLGGNNLPLALMETASYASGEDEEGRKLIVFVITDGGESVTQAMHDAVALFPAESVHMLLVDNRGACNPEMEAAWRTVAFGSFTRLDTFDTARMASELAEVVADAIGATAPEARRTRSSSRYTRPSIDARV